MENSNVRVLVNARTREYKDTPANQIIVENKPLADYVAKIAELENRVAVLENSCDNLKGVIVKLCDILASVNNAAASAQIDTSLVINQLDVLINR